MEWYFMRSKHSRRKKKIQQEVAKVDGSRGE